MKRTSILLALMVFSALPALAETSEFGVMIGGSRRFVDGAPKEDDVTFEDSTFALSNNAFDIYWAIPLDPTTYLKFKAGRIQTQVPVGYNIEGSDELFRRDEDGDVAHIEANVEYRFAEAFGSTGLFGGLGFYRQSTANSDSVNNYGINAGVNADFPITRRYGVVAEATYHWTRFDFQPRYLTVTGGLRIAF
jgi:hypothetical protein